MKRTAIIEPEDDGFVSKCPELDIASQGDTEQEARANLKEALELFFEVAEEEEVQQRLAETPRFGFSPLATQTTLTAHHQKGNGN